MGKNERWGVYAWTRNADGTVEARINNRIMCEEDARTLSQSVPFYGYDSKVVVPARYFKQAWEMIGAVVHDPEVEE